MSTCMLMSLYPVSKICSQLYTPQFPPYKYICANDNPKLTPWPPFLIQEAYEKCIWSKIIDIESSRNYIFLKTLFLFIFRKIALKPSFYKPYILQT